jgi:hypothetical protein
MSHELNLFLEEISGPPIVGNLIQIDVDCSSVGEAFSDFIPLLVGEEKFFFLRAIVSASKQFSPLALISGMNPKPISRRSPPDGCSR